LYVLEEALLAELQPSLLITQELCDVCAVAYDDVCSLSARLPGSPRVISLTPPSLSAIFDDVRTVSCALGIPARGEALVAQMRRRLDSIVKCVESLQQPRVFAMEWLEPPFAAGHWVPEMVALAGGQEVLGVAGEKSFRVTWDQIIDARPEIILLIPCGYNAAQAQAEWDSLPKPAAYHTIPAIQTGRVYAIDANSYCSRPAPRVVDGIEKLSHLFHPNAVGRVQST
jgi:iron complex transport system substrate-binding protein